MSQADQIPAPDRWPGITSPHQDSVVFHYKSRFTQPLPAVSSPSPVWSSPSYKGVKLCNNTMARRQSYHWLLQPHVQSPSVQQLGQSQTFIHSVEQEIHFHCHFLLPTYVIVLTLPPYLHVTPILCICDSCLTKPTSYMLACVRGFKSYFLCTALHICNDFSLTVDCRTWSWSEEWYSEHYNEIQLL